jgi:hypothetical protein
VDAGSLRYARPAGHGRTFAHCVAFPLVDVALTLALFVALTTTAFFFATSPSLASICSISWKTDSFFCSGFASLLVAVVCIHRMKPVAAADFFLQSHVSSALVTYRGQPIFQTK